MNLARSGMATAAVGGQFYVFGGSPPTRAATGSVEAYDPGSDTWTTRTPSTTARSYAAAGSISGKIYLAGGCIGSDCGPGLTNLLEEYDPQADSWTTKQPMPSSRTLMVAGVIGNKFYVAGGTPCGPCAALTPTGELDAYDPVSNTWQSLTPMPKPVHQASAAIDAGKLYVIGGDDYFDGSGLPVPDSLNIVQVYNPSTNQWSTVKPMPTAISANGADNLNAFLFSVGGQINGVPGQAGVIPLVEVYNPIADSWCTGAPIPTPLYLARCNAWNGVLYCVGGDSTNNALATLQAFTPTR
jgi:N-acetylneuraminic acid mutarotase